MKHKKKKGTRLHCTKLPFHDKETAEIKVKLNWAQYREKHRVYMCNICGMYHTYRIDKHL